MRVGALRVESEWPARGGSRDGPWLDELSQDVPVQLIRRNEYAVHFPDGIAPPKDSLRETISSDV